MESNTEIERLIIEKLLGSISAEDEAVLNDALKGNFQARAKWVAMKEFFEKPENTRFINEIAPENAWHSISNEITIKKSSLSLQMYGAIAAVAACLIFVLWLVLIPEHNGPAVASKTTSQKNKGITLKLGNGQTVELAKRNNVQHIDGTTIHTDLIGLNFQTDGELATSWNILEVPSKLDYHVTLSDGTEVWINSASSLHFPFKFGNKREVRLEGEAYFKVAKDEKHPFIVHTNSTVVQVLGTEFNVHAYNERVTTSLVHGKVQTSASGKSVQLAPGFEAVYSEGNFSDQPFDSETVLSWRTGVYHFENENLASILDIIPRWFGLKVTFDKPELQSQKITGSISKRKPLGIFLENLEATTGIICEVKNGVLHLK